MTIKGSSTDTIEPQDSSPASLSSQKDKASPDGHGEDPEPSKPEQEAETTYPPTRKVLVIMASIMLVQLLISLDRLIIGVAIPRITNEFHSLGDVGWYGSAYLLTSCAFGLLMGRIYTFYNPKWIFIASVVIFEIGSAVCGAAPSSNALIVGRAIAGLGSAGCFQGAIIIVVHVIPLHKRPQYMGFIGIMLGLASALGPLIGGALTDSVGWRWCFYINLPCGGLVVFLLILVLKIDSTAMQQEPSTWREKINRLDPIGTLFFLPSIICLLLALQWGGVVYAWSNARIIVLLVVFALCFIAFLIVQRWKGKKATVPGYIFFNRNIIAGACFSFFIFGSLITLFYFIPIWFQAVKGASAIESGIMNLPMVLGLAITSVLAGILTRKIGYYAPWMILASILAPIGAGLISTFTPTTGHPSWIGFQAILGIGVGFGIQQPLVAAQTVLAKKDVPTGASVMMFSQLLGGTVFISVGNNLLDLHLANNLAQIPGLDVGAIVKAGATELRNSIPAAELPQVLVAYNDALRTVFYLAVAMTCAMSVGALAMEWKSVKQGHQKPPTKGTDIETEKSGKDLEGKV